ncbi:MAG: hypothetical protein RR884_07980 [Acinetobacter sp.]|jgi:hypothetical protein|uniref:hypothetical protein n=1 Tax=Acinetobacter sp. TaxID=472 RepID=UPI000FC1C22D|nr:hypothetical protein [Acinetobacter sp.]MBP9788725.1 hypothetical protein [Acinetobacter sp.]RUP36183.1 MAG: hypothetical protein EKK63_18100 [Acinetobacter sp.]
MKIQELQALINGQIQPQQICIEQLVTLARQHTLTNTPEYKLLDDAVNIVLIHYLKQAQAYL